jgi:polar amino acid transport system substrate-binding protein
MKHLHDGPAASQPLAGPVHRRGRRARSRVLASCFAAMLVVAAAPATADDPVELHLGSDEWPPFTGGPDSERAATDLVQTALERIGIEATTTIEDWKTIEARIRRGELDGSAAMWRSKQREKDLLFSVPYLENRLVLVGRSGSDVTATRIAELTGKRVAVVGSYQYGDAIDDAVGVYYVASRNDQDSLDKLLAGKVDYMLVDELVAQHLLTFQPDETSANLAIGVTPLVRRPLHFAIRRDLPNAKKIVSGFDSEIRALQADGTYSEILRVGWIRVDVDGDGLYELVPLGDQLGEAPPGTVYDVFGEMPTEEPDDQQRIIIQGHLYEGWDAIPDRYKVPSSPGGSTSFRYGSTFVGLKF